MMTHVLASRQAALVRALGKGCSPLRLLMEAVPKGLRAGNYNGDAIPWMVRTPAHLRRASRAPTARALDLRASSPAELLRAPSGMEVRDGC